MVVPWIQNPLAVLVTLAATTAFFFWLEDRTHWRLFTYFPPLLFVYAVPLVLSNTGVLTRESAIYDWMGQYMLPFLLTVMLLRVDMVAAVRVMGRGVVVMLCGTLGVVLGAPLAYAVVRGHLDPEGWKAFGTLAGSWIGGTGNMAAMKQGLEASDTAYGLAALADNAVYLVWLPILLGSKKAAGWFHRWVRVDERRLRMLTEIDAGTDPQHENPDMRHLLYLLLLGSGVTWLAVMLAPRLPEWGVVLKASSWQILIVTTLGLGLSFTSARRLPGSHALAMALLYLFVAKMGAGADLRDLRAQAPWFLFGAGIWILFHGAFCVLAARLLHVDIHSTAIASAANIGGAASATVVAAHHNPRLVPVSILMALLGYAVGNYGALLAAWLCQLLA